MTCVRGASIGFVSHKTAGSAGELPDTAAGRRWQNDPNTLRRKSHRTEQGRTPETARRREARLPRESLFRPDELHQTGTPQQADGAATFRDRVRAGSKRLCQGSRAAGGGALPPGVGRHGEQPEPVGAPRPYPRAAARRGRKQAAVPRDKRPDCRTQQTDITHDGEDT